ncbi:MAG TPA: tetratricopeptide repeat protein, partial [Holophaga sp.]|nr:tetratricopeptide repeat protein [Holophaga sp.]
PSHPTLQNNLGYLLLELDQDLPEASTLIAAALKQEPDNPSTLDSWGWALFKQKRYAEAEPVLRRAAGLQPLNPEVLKHFGEALLHLDRKAEALDQWERALAFAFPERKALERRVQQLRADLARQQPSEEPEPEPDPETTDEGEERR